MKKTAVLPVFLLLFVLAGVCEGVGEAERFIMQNPALLRRLLLGVVAVVGIAIIAMRLFFNRGKGERSAAGLDNPGEAKPASPGLKPAKLIEIHDNRAFSIPLDGGLTLGRVLDNHVVLKNPSVSRHHAKIVPEQEGYVLYDLGSKKGTSVNGEMVDRKLLRNSDMIEIGREDFMFVYE